MSPKYTVRKLSFCVFWSRALAVGTVLFPLSLTRIDFRATFSNHLSVSAKRSSPAFAAFEDTITDYQDTKEIQIEPIALLKSGTPNSVKTESAPVHRIALGGMTLRAPPATPVEDVIRAPVLAARDIVRPQVSVPRLPAQSFISKQNLYTDDAPSSFTSVADRAEDLVKRELTAHPMATDPTSRIITSQTGTQILVAKSAPLETAAPLVKTAERSTARPESSVPILTVSASPSAGKNSRPLWLNGQIEMTGGLAFVGPETQLVVKRVVNGEVLEKGRIWITEGRFEIHVNRAAGFLVAELQRRDGRVLGRGELDLLNLNAIADQDNRIADLRIALHPATETASLRTVSAYSHDSQIMPMTEARVEVQTHSDPIKVNAEGVLTDPTLTRESSFIARASAPKNWPTLVVGQAGQPRDVRLFSNSLIEALINLSTRGTDRAEASRQAIVWGQIARTGKPVEGAKVEMAGDRKPVYFDSAYLPDEHLSATGKNGLFAFVNVPAGVQAVRVQHEQRTYPAQVFPTEAKHVSYLDLDLRDKLVSTFKVMDVFDLNRPISAKLKLVGNDNGLTIGYHERVEYAVASQTFMVEADAGPEFEVSRTTLTGAPHDVNIPLVKREWLHRLADERAIVSLPGQGIVAGFVDKQDFEVDTAGLGGPVARAGGPAPQIVYVDASGKALPGHTGVAGGGFVIFNAPAGLQTVFIHPAQSRESFAQVVVPESGIVHVMTF